MTESNNRFAEQLSKVPGFIKTPIPTNPELRPKYLKDIRNALGLTQADFWGHLGVKPGTGAKYEAPLTAEANQRRECPPDVLYRLAKWLELDWSVEDNKLLVIETTKSEGNTIVSVSTSALEMIDFCSNNFITMRDLKKYVEMREIWNKK